jgi:molybdopterin-containing oxidoreductase family iron-sulfur binding subunit
MTRLRADGAVWRRDDSGGDGVVAAYAREKFPAVADLLQAPDRRQFFRLMAASFAMSGLAGCDDDDGRDEVVPPVQQAQGSAPGTVLRYASSALIDGFANGVLVTTRDGRPIKIEGNPAHPWSQGGTDVFGQASVLDLWDPFRSQSVRQATRDADWQSFRGAMVGPLAALRASGGAGFGLLIGPITSPSLIAQIARLQADWPHMRVFTHAPADRSALYEGTRRVFGQKLETHWRLAGARVVVCLDGDLLDAGPQQVGVGREWAAARRQVAADGGLLALHAVGAVPNLTRAKADFPLCASPGMIEAMAQAILAHCEGGAGPALPDEAARWCEAASRALRAAPGAGVVQAGLHASADLHARVARLNATLGNTGKTVLHTAALTLQGEDLAALTQAMEAGAIGSLLMIGCNPVYDSPADLRFADSLLKVKLKIHAGLMADETAQNADWHLPMAHPLESWGDARSLDGTASLIQPTIAPLYDGRTASEIISVFADQEPRAAIDLLRAHWLGPAISPAGEAAWRQALLSGVMQDGAAPLQEARMMPAGGGASPPAAAPAPGQVELVFRCDPTVWDGSFGDNGWLQELPKPLTKLVWENVAGVGPALAERLHLRQGDVVEIMAGGRSIEAPVWITGGQADDVVSLTLGYGHRVVGQLSAGLGYDAYALRQSATPWRLAKVVLRRTGETRLLATTQELTSMEGHDFVRVQRVGMAPVGDGGLIRPTLYPKQESDGRAWGMVIDLDSCIGCNACVVACQAENNIAVVGKEAVANGRDMHWLRIDMYEGPMIDGGFGGGGTSPPTLTSVPPPTHFMPVPCMQCEQAPCEVGCPVEATLHDHEGLNLMVYNRCVGTRACSGYCPYKVRKFNYADYSGGAAPSIVEQRNPEVTVRSRGVMEKCTYCVQRIVQARIVADRDNTPIPVDSVRTACQAACPTNAIVFGDLAQADSKIAKLQADPRRYALLGELNTRPRTTYLAACAPAAGEG